MSESGSGPAYGPSVYPPPGGDNSTIFNVTGTYTGPASRAYLYYTNEHKQWTDGLRVEIEPIAV